MADAACWGLAASSFGYLLYILHLLVALLKQAGFPPREGCEKDTGAVEPLNPRPFHALFRLLGEVHI
jgi:hypothetical protein